MLMGCCAAFAIVAVASCGSKTIEGPLVSRGGASGSAGASNMGGAASSGAPTNQGSCSIGDTRTCVGPGACTGGQVCGEDGRWAMCDCGDASGGPSNGGASGAAGSDNAGAGGESEQGASGAGGTGDDGAATAGAGGAADLDTDQPCPSVPIKADCSGLCTATKGLCVVDPVCPTKVRADYPNLGDVIVRTPSRPVANCGCSPGVAPSGYWMHVDFKGAGVAHWHVSVPGPWHVKPLGIGPLCESKKNLSSCAAFSTPLDNLDGGLEVWTEEPDAPAINLFVEAGECP